MKTVICGGEEKAAWMRWRSYAGVDGAACAGFCGAGAEARAAAWGGRAWASFEAVLLDPSVTAVELLDFPADRAKIAEAALDAGKSAALAPPLAFDAHEAGSLAKKALSSKATLAVGDPWPFFPPLQKIARLVKKRAVGRVTAVRMRALIAENGGWDDYLNPDYRPAGASGDAGDLDPEERLARELYVKLALAHRLLGHIEEIFLNRPEALDAPFSAVATWKHCAAATYGCLDVSYAPEVRIRSAYDARDDQMEFTGSSGIIWLTRASAQLRNEPTVRVHRDDNQFAFGNLPDDFMIGHTEFTRTFSRAARSGDDGVFRDEIKTAVQVSRTLQAALESGRANQPMKISV